MVKKIFSVMILAAALIFIGNNQAEAREVYVGSYSDGTAVYILTETISKKHYTNGEFLYTCRVRAGRDYLDYTFGGNDNQDDMATWYKNSEGYSGGVFTSNSPVARAIFMYIARY